MRTLALTGQSGHYRAELLEVLIGIRLRRMFRYSFVMFHYCLLPQRQRLWG